VLTFWISPAYILHRIWSNIDFPLTRKKGEKNLTAGTTKFWVWVLGFCTLTKFDADADMLKVEIQPNTKHTPYTYTGT